MDAGELADEIKNRLGLKLKAWYEGDDVQGSVTVATNEVIITAPELSSSEKSLLDEIVKNHYSEKIAKELEHSIKERGKEEPYVHPGEPTLGSKHGSSS